MPVDPSAATLLNSLIPLPNNGVVGYRQAPDLPTNFREDSGRVDQNISDKTRLFVRFTQDAFDQSYVPALWTASEFATVDTVVRLEERNGVMNLTSTFRPNLMNEVVLGYSSDTWNQFSTLGTGPPSGSILKSVT